MRKSHLFPHQPRDPWKAHCPRTAQQIPNFTSAYGRLSCSGLRRMPASSLCNWSIIPTLRPISVLAAWPFLPACAPPPWQARAEKVAPRTQCRKEQATRIEASPNPQGTQDGTGIQPQSPLKVLKLTHCL